MDYSDTAAKNHLAGNRIYWNPLESLLHGPKIFPFQELMRNTVGHYSIFLSFRIMRLKFLPRSKERDFYGKSFDVILYEKSRFFIEFELAAKAQGYIKTPPQKQGF